MLLAFLPVLATGNLDGTQVADAKSVLKVVRAQFPSDPITISGAITVRRRRGVVVKELGYTIDAVWTEQGGKQTCVFSDAFGRESDTVQVSFNKGEEPRIQRDGEVLVDENGKVKGTELECKDLAMPFLWWDDCELVGKDKTRGRECYVIDIDAPKGEGVARLRVWIDETIFIVLKAESYNSDDKLVKQVLVKSFKKIDDQWMIKDLEIRGESSAVKTVVTVEAMKTKQKNGGSQDR
jgi:hypothetical protein